MNKKCLTVALVGESNAGKSTLLNELVGHKVSIVTHKVQTTRNNIRGVTNIGDTQLIFIDTPGIFNPEGTLEKAIVNQALTAFDQADIICIVFDARRVGHPVLPTIHDYAQKSGKKCYALINKVDLVTKEKLMPSLQYVYDLGIFTEVFPISALKAYGTKHFMEFLLKQAPQGDWHFIEEEMTDQPSKTLAEEITREQAYLLLHEEIPYSLKVETEQWEDLDNGDVKIYQSIFVNKSTQKPIVLGKNGEKIKEIGQRARKEISRVLNTKVHLFLHVKVREDWIEKDFGNS